MAKKDRLEQRGAANSEKESKSKDAKEVSEAQDWSSGAKDSNKKQEEERKRLELLAKKSER